MASRPYKSGSNIWAITKRDFSEINFKWTIENFSLYPYETEKFIESPLFGGDGEKEWRLIMYPGGIDEETAGYVSLYLDYNGPDMITVDFGMKIEDSNGKLVCHAVDEDNENQKAWPTYRHVFNPNDGWGYCKLVERDKLETDGELLPNDTLTVVCEMKVYTDPIDRIKTLNITEPAVKDSASRNCLADLYDTTKCSDVTFVVNDKKIQAHKCVLASCSVVFDAMFSNEMKEKETNEVKIDDVEERVFTEMLRFIYTGQVENSNVIAADLLSVADKYDLKHLKDFAQLEMMKNFSVETAAKFLILADLHRSELLKEETIKYISRNSAAVIKTEGWKQLITTYLHLLVEIFEYQNL